VQRKATRVGTRGAEEREPRAAFGGGQSGRNELCSTLLESKVLAEKRAEPFRKKGRERCDLAIRIGAL